MDILSISLATKKTLEKLGVKIVPDTVITFDGNFEGKEDYGGFIRVSEKAIDIHAVTSVKFHSEGGEPEIYGVEDFEYVDAIIPGCGFIFLGGDTPVVLSLGEDSTLGDLHLPAGTYFLAEADFWLEELVIPGTIHPIDPKFLPKGGVGYEEMEVLCEVLLAQGELPDWGLVSGVFEDETIMALGLEAGKTYLLTFDNEKYEAVCKEITPEGHDNAYQYFGNLFLDGLSDTDTGENFLVFPVNGMCYIKGKYSTFKIETEVVHQIEPKFIPGAVLPVVEFAAVSPGEITDEAIVEQLNYALENAYAIIMRMVGGGADVSTILIKAVMPDMFTGFLMPGESLGSGTNLELKDNVWMLNA